MIIGKPAVVYTVHTFTEKVQRVKADLTVLRRGQLGGLDIYYHSDENNVLSIHTKFAVLFQQPRFRTRESDFCAVQAVLNCCFYHVSQFYILSRKSLFQTVLNFFEPQN